MKPFASLRMRPQGGAAFAGMASLFAAAEKGGYWDFVDGTKLAINADGTGGTPAVGSAVKWAVDQSPNANHLRNTTASTVMRRANGVETDGTGYGLFNFSGFGNWPTVVNPFEVVACLEQKTFTATGNNIINMGGGLLGLVEGTSSGKVRFRSNPDYSPEYTPGLLTEYTLDCYLSAAQSEFSFNNSAFVTNSMATNSISELTIGSAANGTINSAVRIKRLLVVGRKLTTAERAGVYAWASA